MQERFYAPKYSKLARSLEIAKIKRKEEIELAENNYKKILKIIREICKKNGHKYDDGVSALVRGRYGYNDYRYECQICGVEIPDK